MFVFCASLIKVGSSLERRMLLFVGGLLLVLVFFACANVVAPTGGPRDEDPPVVERSLPPNYSPNFEGGQIRVFFNEFIVLNNLRQQLLVSPPMENDPEIRVRGRSLIIDIEDELRSNTTYNIFLGDAVRDNTEGNAIPNFQFVFSTGDYVDSLSLSGQVVNAFTLEPEESVFVMLYDSIYDSIPYKERPVYLSKTNKEGIFTITNMKEGAYLMFALVDNNGNFLYDLPDEKIAFLDSLVSPRFVAAVAENDTTSIEGDEGETGRGDEGTTLRGDEDTTIRGDEGTTLREDEDTTIRGDEVTTLRGGEDMTIRGGGEELPFYTLYLFQERDTVQRIVSRGLVRKGQIRLTFRVPYDSICFRDIRGELNDDWYMTEFSTNRDSLNVWYTDLEQDSLFLEVYDGLHLMDTLVLSTRPRETRERGRNDTTTESELPRVSLAFEGPTGRTLPYYMSLSAKASAPLQYIDHEKITALKSDTIPIEVSFEFTDTLRRRFVMSQELEENEAYQIEFLPGAFTDMFGATNDTIRRSFRTDSHEDYGILIVNIDLNQLGAVGRAVPNEQDTLAELTVQPTNYILQLLDKSGIAIREKFITASGIFRFVDLRPDNYSFRLIEDLNNNQKWDTGNYLKGILPERVFMYGETFQIRQNWEMEESWIVGSQ